MAFDQKAYNRTYYDTHAEQFRQNSRAYHAAHKDDPDFQEKITLRREVRHFGVPRSVIFRKTDGQCSFCGKPADIIHHLDDDGRTHERQGKTPGHDPARLVGVCRACHLDIHRASMMHGKKTRARGFWSRTHSQCIECGRDDRKHEGHGRCVNCAARQRTKRKRGGV